MKDETLKYGQHDSNSKTSTYVADKVDCISFAKDNGGRVKLAWTFILAAWKVLKYGVIKIQSQECQINYIDNKVTQHKLLTCWLVGEGELENDWI